MKMKFFAILSMISAVLVLYTASIFLNLIFSRPEPYLLERNSIIGENLTYNMEEFRAQVEAVSVRNERLSEAIEAIEAPIGDAHLNVKLESLSQRLEVLEGDMEIIEIIEVSLGESVERALSVPMMRSDIDTVRRDLISYSSQIEAEIDRIYDLVKWFIGLMVTIAVGILGLAVGNFLKS